MAYIRGDNGKKTPVKKPVVKKTAVVVKPQAAKQGKIANTSGGVTKTTATKTAPKPAQNPNDLFKTIGTPSLPASPTRETIAIINGKPVGYVPATNTVEQGLNNSYGNSLIEKTAPANTPLGGKASYPENPTGRLDITNPSTVMPVPDSGLRPSDIGYIPSTGYLPDAGIIQPKPTSTQKTPRQPPGVGGRDFTNEQYNPNGEAQQPLPTPAEVPTGGGKSGGGGGGASVGGGGAGGIQTPTIPTGGSGTGTGTTGSGSTSGGTGAGGTMPAQQPIPESNVYFDQLINTKFDYDPATDKDYWKAAANAENAIIQSMIGRGGMYSAVAQSAVAVKLTDLAIEYETLAYEKYVDERNFTFQMAQFEQNRMDTLWNQNFQLTKYESDLRQQQFQNEMAIAEFKFAQEKEKFDEKMAIAANNRANQQLALQKASVAAAKKAAEAKNTVANELMKNRIDTQKMEEMVTRWAAKGEASAEVAKYFSAYGVQQHDDISAWEDIIQAKENALADDAYRLAGWAAEVGEAEMAAGYLDSYMKPATTVNKGYSPETSDQTMKINYSNFKNNVLGSGASVATIQSAITKLTNKADTYYPAMGDYYYNKLIDDLESEKSRMRNKTGADSSAW